MPKFLKTLRTYYKLAGVKKYLIALEFFTLLIPSILSVWTPVFSANVISSLTVYDFSGAIKYLEINFGIIIVSALVYLFYHITSNHVRKIMSINLHSFVYQNVRGNTNLSSISISVLSNIEALADFNREFLFKLCFFIKSIILLSIIIYHNALIGIILICVSFLSYIFFSLTDSKIKKNNKIFSENQNRTLELFNSIKRGSEEEQTFNFENLLKDKYFKFVDESIKTSNKTSTLYFVNNNIISLILKSAVFGLTVYLVLMVKATTLTLSLYLILTPYLSTSAENLIEFFAVFAKIGEVENKLSELESLKYTTTKQKVLSSSPFETFNLTFYHAELSEPNAPQIFDANFKVNFCESAEFVGDENSGKRAIFYLLQKKYKLSSGTIFIDDKNIFDIESETYKKLISFTSKQTHFFNISIMENLQMVCSSRNKIFACFKEWGLKSDIFKLEEKENTIITQNSNKKLLYFLGILRAYLSDSKIIAIYETPENFTALDREKFRKILGVMKKDRTILYFSHSDEFSSVFDKTFYVEGSKIKNSKYEKV